ncbi:MAG: M20/M25/M40 family metallo-hydrolase [Anaerolineae bacterium]
MAKSVQLVEKKIEWADLPNYTQVTLDEAIALQQIPAPTFDEAARMRHVAEKFAALGLHNIETDDLYNVYGVLPGEDRHAPGLMLVAHTDTVFPAETDLSIRHEQMPTGTASAHTGSRTQTVIYGPGLGDNSIGVASLFTLAHILREQKITPPCDLYFTATSREEGLGDLGGMRAAFARLKDRVKAVINVEGLAFGHIYHAGIAVRRLKITASAEGGHSWLHFGRPSAVHGVLNLGARIATITPPANPRTTYNIGLIEGGRSINTIATEASLWLDMRSERRSALEALEQQVQGHIRAVQHNDLRFSVEVVGDRPSGELAPEHPLVLMALAALNKLGVRGSLETGSTDGNISLAAGVPTVTIGITRGGNAHRTDEYIELEPIKQGLQQLGLLALTAAAYRFE